MQSKTQTQVTPQPSFMKRHSRAFLAVGSLIVLATFIGKEVLSEKWKGQADAVDRAQTLYAIDGHAAQLHNEINASWWEQHVKDEAAKKYREHEEVYLQASRRAVADYWRSAEIEETLAKNTKHLIDRLPNNTADQLEYNKYWNEFSRYQVQLGEIRKAIEEKFGKWEAEWRPKEKERLAKEIEEDLVQRGFFVSVLLARSNKWPEYSEHVLAKAEAERLKNEDYSNYAWIAATVLYVLGWGLALVGRFYDLPVALE